ncbi:MAG: IS21 family transposase [Candidatus Scalindua sp.]|nr:IS21 family transposase [Candidatus Scalindua sp.]
MSRSKLKMRQIREILRYRFDHGVSLNNIKKTLNISKGSVVNTLKRFEESSLSWPLPNDLSDSQLEQILYPPSSSKSTKCDLVEGLEKELSRPHVTLQLLYEEYHENNPNGMKRTAFYDHYNKNSNVKQPLTMKMHHKGGDKLYIDYSGDSISYIDKSSGEVVKTQLFVSSWGASSYCYVDVTASQNQEDFTLSHIRAFNYFGCIPNALVPDNLKSAVIKAKRIDPVINRLYGEMADHYDIVVLPARVRKPQDKAVVESNVLHIQRFILGRLRDRTFYSLNEINRAVRVLLEEFNDRAMRDYGNQTRRQRFKELDLPEARDLPKTRFSISKIASNILVGKNYHIRFDSHNYSVPNQYVGKRVEVFQKGHIIEIYHDSVHLCRHLKGKPNFGHTTLDEHMPKSHRFQKGLTPDWLVYKGNEIHQDVGNFIQLMMKSRNHPEQAFNGAMGVLRLEKVYSSERLQNACRRATYFKSVDFKTLKSILEKGLDQFPWDETECSDDENIIHENIRGSAVFKQEEGEKCI